MRPALAFFVGVVLACCSPGGGGGGPYYPPADSGGDAGGGDVVAADPGATSPDLPMDPGSTPDPGLVADVPPDPGAPDVPPDPGQPDPGAADTPAGPTEFGGGVLLTEVDSAYVNVAVAAARFTDPVPTTPSGTTYGPCVVHYSQPDDLTPKDFGYDAGVLTVSSTTPTVTLTPVDEGALGTGYVSNLSGDHVDLLPGGGALIFVNGAGGADIGAFSLVIQAPEQMLVATPDVATGGTISSMTDTLVTWQAGSGDSVLVTLTPLSNDMIPEPTSGTAITCVQQGDTGSLAIPAAALNDMSAQGTSRVVLGVTRVKTGQTQIGDLTVRGTATRSTGGMFEVY